MDRTPNNSIPERRDDPLCAGIDEQLTDYLDGTLAPEPRVRFESHLAGCADCTAMLTGVGALVRDLHQLEPVQEPPHLASAIILATLGPRRRPLPWGRAKLGWFAWLTQPAFTYGAVSVMITFIVLAQALGLPSRKVALADLKPVNMANLVNRQAHHSYARTVKFISDLRLVYEIQTRLHPNDQSESVVEPSAEPSRQRVPGEPSSHQFEGAQHDLSRLAVLLPNGFSPRRSK